MPNPAFQVPFSRDESFFADGLSSNVSPASNAAVPSNTTRPRLVLPGFYYHSSRQMRKVDVNNNTTFREYLAQELDVKKLLEIFQHLWLAGQPHAARPLHYQIMIGRSIITTERADRHLTWNGHQILLKPLPDFFLDYSIWERHIVSDELLYESAVGFLLSYTWLINSKSDLKIAHDANLLPSGVTWESWVAFSSAVLSRIDHEGLTGVNPRYLYGELRISRLNLIWRFLHRPWKLADLVRGYTIRNREYSRLATKSFAWLLGSFLYITVVLTAMQVGLSVNQLDNDHRFQNASYGFTVFSIIAPLVGVAIITIVLLGAILHNLKYTRHINEGRRDIYDRLWDNPALAQHRRQSFDASISKEGLNSTSKDKMSASHASAAV